MPARSPTVHLITRNLFASHLRISGQATRGRNPVVSITSHSFSERLFRSRVVLAHGVGGFSHDVPFNKVQAACRLNDAAHLAGLEAKGGVLELLLHVALAKVAQVAALAGRGAVRLGGGDVAEAGAQLDLLLVALEDRAGFFLGAGDFGLGG